MTRVQPAAALQWTPRSWRSLAWQGIRANALPMAILCVFGAVLALLYYFHRPTQAALDGFAAWACGSHIYPPAAMAFAAGVAPWLTACLLRRGHRSWREPAMILFWAAKGVEVYWLYRLQAVMFGTGVGPATVACKVAFDMGVYAPFWGLPTTISATAWMQDVPLRSPLKADFWKARYVPGLLVNWGLWIPAVCIIYSLPPGLQFPVNNIFVCMWVLMLVILSSPEPRPQAEPRPGRAVPARSQRDSLQDRRCGG